MFGFSFFCTFSISAGTILVSTLKDEQRIDAKQRKKILFLNLELKLKEKDFFINFLKKKKIV